MEEIEVLSIPGLRLTAYVEDRLVKQVLAEGPLAPFARSTLKLMDDFIVREKPAFIGDSFIVPSLFFPPLPGDIFSRSVSNEIKARITRKNVPQILSVSVTEKCMVDCFLCGHWGRRKSPELSGDEMVALIDEAIGMGVFNITFTGGDPMLRKDIYSLISHVRDTGGAISTMFTPGVRLAGRARELKEAGLYSVYVILSNVSPEKHDEMVGTPGTFELAVRGIRECISCGILTGIATYVTRERLNDGTIERLIDFAGELGVHEVLLSDPLPTGKMLRNEQFILDKAERQRLVAMQKDYNTRPRGTKIFTNSCVKGPTGVGCVAGNKWVHVTAVGEVSPCDYTPLSFGNVKNGGLAPVWNRIQRHATYSRHSDECRIQDFAFRRRYIDRIPEGAVLPYPIDRIEG